MTVDGVFKMYVGANGNAGAFMQLTLSVSNEPDFSSGLMIVPFDVVEEQGGNFVNTVALDSGEFGAGTIAPGLAFVLPADYPDTWVDTSARAEAVDTQGSGVWGFQLAILKNLDTMGGGSTRFGALKTGQTSTVSDQMSLPYSLQVRKLLLTAGDYLYVVVATNLTSAILSDNAEFTVTIGRANV